MSDRRACLARDILDERPAQRDIHLLASQTNREKWLTSSKHLFDQQEIEFFPPRREWAFCGMWLFSVTRRIDVTATDKNEAVA
jgi:hypothetical protein